MNSLKILISGAFLFAVALVPLAGSQLAFAQSTTAPELQESLCAGANDLQYTPGVSGSCDTSQDASTTVNDIVILVVNVFSWIVGVISVIMIIYGGFKYITSGGDTGNVTTAKNTILYAIIGLIIVALAQLIVRFVLGTVTGAADGV